MISSQGFEEIIPTTQQSTTVVLVSGATWRGKLLWLATGSFCTS
jgi:hypothetical protein